MGKDKVVIYTTPTCPYCNRVKEYFKDLRIEFINYDVTKEEDALEEMRELTDSGVMVPVIKIGGEIIIGFDESRIEKELKKIGKGG